MARPTKKYSLQQTVAEAKLKTPLIEIELDNGDTVALEPSQFWPDEAFDLASKGKLNELALLLLGGEQYDRYIAGGGTASALQLIVGEHSGLTVGESPAS